MKRFYLVLIIIAIAAPTATIATLLGFSQAQASPAYASEPHPDAPYKKPERAFSSPSANLTQEEQMAFTLGRSLFKKIWVSSPSSTTASDGLGPLYNARSCLRCHIRNGRGHPIETNNLKNPAGSIIMRLSIPAQTPQQQAMLDAGKIGVIPEPIYGTQLQDLSVQGLQAEGRINVRYQEIAVRFPDDTATVSLRKPEYRVEQLQYGPLHAETQLSLRVAPPMIGLGLLAAIKETDIIANEDPDDHNHDGISGRTNHVWDIEQQQSVIGRFGWKAGNPTLKQQNNAALHADMGISSPMFPKGAGECTTQQIRCQAMPNGNSAHLDNAEASAQIVDWIEFYTRNLAVPAQRNTTTKTVINGEKLFTQIGCQQCHTPRYVTTGDAPAAQANQTIWPYTDLLLHDMGEGLADHRPEFVATGREWRTPPLWGIGLTQAVSQHTQFLHDGRARNLLEAILWHGGEAEASKRRFMQLTPSNRHHLITFVESL
ncbi:di-heme oxidoredictase family protein [Neptunomonas antarctica]|uniref:CxxC motif-containing protein, DUF1111 family n=1 Tax=Neptunomonas antarctica TaxID=619304 RepID=A0A1N7IUL7_9GAMM|nr:di-heme oxidoredictase family protein [Neptunomonas antarctica]SIS40707.1 CxxC motif-containing protein, DUF1111 family [Neptunomonas antarctica]